MRDASWSEVARIKGEWERLVTRYVRKEFLQLEGVYLDQARRTLQRAFARGDRDPRLLATLGLLELDAGNEVAAQLYLEEAVGKSVVRPRVYVELAKFRFDQELARATRNDGKLSLAQTEDVLDILMVAARQAPSLSPVYELIADVWMNCVEEPGADDFAVIDEGIGLFPRSGELRLPCSCVTQHPWGFGTGQNSRGAWFAAREYDFVERAAQSAWAGPRCPNTPVITVPLAERLLIFAGVR